MLNGKYTGIDRVIEGVFRDYGWTHEVDWIDAIGDGVTAYLADVSGGGYRKELPSIYKYIR